MNSQILMNSNEIFRKIDNDLDTIRGEYSDHQVKTARFRNNQNKIKASDL